MSATNKKLTTLIAGRTINQATQESGETQIKFTDGSEMRIKTDGPFDGLVEDKEVKAVRQKGADFSLDFADDSSAQITLAEETSSVMLRDKDGEMEYAD